VNATQICRLFDMHPVAIVGSKDKAKFVQENYSLEPAQAIFLCFFLFFIARLLGQGQVFVKKFPYFFVVQENYNLETSPGLVFCANPPSLRLLTCGVCAACVYRRALRVSACASFSLFMSVRDRAQVRCVCLLCLTESPSAACVYMCLILSCTCSCM